MSIIKVPGPEKKPKITLRQLVISMIFTSVVIFLGILIGIPAINNTSAVSNENMLQRFKKIGEADSSELFIKKKLVPFPIIYLDFENKQLVFSSEKTKEDLRFRYSKKDSIFTVNNDDTTAFDKLITKNFPLNNYSTWVSANKTPGPDDINQIASAFGISKESSNRLVTSARTIVFTMLCKKLISSTSIQQISANGQLEDMATDAFTVDVVNKPKLERSLEKLATSDKSDQEKFIDEEYLKAHRLSSKPANNADGYFLDSLFEPATFNFDLKPKFLFLNESKHILYINNEGFPYDENSFVPADADKANKFVENELAIHKQAGLNLRDSAMKHGISYKNSASDTTASLVGIFRSIALIIHSDQGPYFIIGNRLVNPKENDPDFKYINFKEREKSFNDLKNESVFLPRMVLIRQSVLIYLVLFITAFLIAANLAISRFGFRFLPDWLRRIGMGKIDPPPTVPAITSEQGSIPEPITGADPENIDGAAKDLKSMGPKNIADGKPGMEQIKQDNAATPEGDREMPGEHLTEFDKLKLKNEQGENLQKIQQLEEILKKIGEFLMVNESQQVDIGDYLEENIGELENNYDIPHLIKFASLFKTPKPGNRPSGQSILDAYNNNQQLIEQFEAIIAQNDIMIKESNGRIESYRKQLKKIADLVANTDITKDDIDVFLEKEIQKVKKTPDIPSMVGFALLFRLPNEPRAESVLKSYFETEKLIREISQHLMNKSKVIPPFFQLQYTVQLGLWTMKALMDIHLPKDNLLANVSENVKINAIRLVLFDSFFQATKGDNFRQGDFAQSIEKINQLTDEFNEIVSDEFKLLRIPDEKLKIELNQLLHDMIMGREAAKIKSLFVDEVQGDISLYLKSKIEATEKDDSAENMIRFATSFKSGERKVFRNVDEILNDLDRNRPAIQEFISSLQRLNGTDIFSRNALIFYALKFGESLIKINGKEMPESYRIDTIKDEQVQLILFKYYINALQKQKFDPAAFFESIQKANLRIAENNKLSGEAMSLEPIDLKRSNSALESNLAFQLLTDGLIKMNMSHSYQIAKKYFEKLDDHFLAAFNSKIKNLRFNSETLNKEDQAWLFEQLFDITFHVADFADYFLKEDDVNYHENYLLLLNDLEFNGKIKYREFLENDLEQSDNSSNAVAKAARFAGVRRLKILINKFYIKAAPNP